MLPSSLKSTSLQTFKLMENQLVEIPQVNLRFDSWTGHPIEDTYNKPILCFDGEPVFAELAILRMFQNEGWQGVWVDTYGRKYRNGYWGANSIAEFPDDKEQLLKDIYEIGKISSGCWDVFCWKDEEVVFAESKRRSKDKIRATQIKWLEAALKFGLRRDSFLIVEWDLSR